jgi:glycosyltransferase involved in cell wall biosynthesis
MRIGIVTIGRNEGDRLRVCVQSALHDSKYVVYVDSGSTDDSVKLAQGLGAQVVELDLSIPFTAARARNAGFEKLLEIAPDLEFVQFVDGDCEIVVGWIERAISQLTAKPQAAVVCGRRRERFPGASIYNMLCDMEWNTPIGKARSCGGDALIRVKAFRDIHGYNPEIIAGEEPEMCVRLRAAGWEIWRIDTEMTLHDAAMTKFSQWWKRTLRSGHAFAEGYAMHGAPPESHNARQTRSIWIWGFVIPVAWLIATGIVLFVAPRWCWIPSIALLLYPLLMLKIARSKHRAGLPMRESMLYAFFVVLGKFPQWLGAFKYQFSRARGRRSTLIEYKSGGVAASATK